MGTIADSLFSVLMSWVRALVNSIWALFTSEHTTLLELLGKNWALIAVALIAAGLVIDWLIWLIRWQPYHIWAQRARRLLHMEEPDEEELQVPQAAGGKSATKKVKVPAEEDWLDADDAWLPLAEPEIDEREEQEVMERAESVPDEELGAYPGMRYGEHPARQEEMDGTRRFAAVHSEGPGAAEVARRRAEIDAWQRQMQEEAQSRAAAERAAREAEQNRLAQEAAKNEQARLAQEQYERELAEYERQRAQYELEMAEYERQKAAYDAEMARIAAEQEAAESETAEELAPQMNGGRARRRRAAHVPYSDYVEGETVDRLPDAPAWPRMESAPQPVREEAKRAKPSKLAKMARLIEPQEEEISGVAALPPRVDMKDAYRPAKKPNDAQGRGR